MLATTSAYVKLKTIWSHLLNSNTILESSDFFHLGGNQKLLLELITQIKNKFELNVTIRELAENSRFDQQISFLNNHAHSRNLNYFEKDIQSQQSYPITIEQNAILTADKLRAGCSPEYNIAYTISLEQPVNIPHLEHAIAQLLTKHVVLRSYFPDTNGSDVVKLITPNLIKLNIIFNINDNFRNIIKELASKPFKLAQEAAIKFYLILTSDNNCRNPLIDGAEKKDTLLIVYHQIILDGDSFNLIFNDLISFYSDKDLKSQTQKKNALSYLKWAQFQKNEICLEEPLAYWQKKLLGYQATQLEMGAAWKARTGNHGRNIQFKINNLTLKTDLALLASQYQTSNFIILLGAFYVLLERYCMQCDLTVATLFSNKYNSKSDFDLENTVGCFLNTLLLRVQLETKKQFQEFINDEVKPTVLEAFKHSKVSPEMITVEKRSSSLFNIVFCYHDLEVENNKNNQYNSLHNGTTKYDLLIEVFSSHTGFEFRICYSSELYHQNLIEDFSRNYLQTIQYIIAHQNDTIASYQLKFRSLTPPNLIWKKNDFDPNHTILDVFYKAVQSKSCEKIIEFNNEFLSVSTFWQTVRLKSNSLRDFAKANLQRELLPGECIGIASSRSLETMTDILAILFAGAAFVPYDPDSPKDRIHYILSNARVKIKLHSGIVYFDEHDLSSPLMNQTKIDHECDLSSMLVKIQSNQLAYIMYTSGSSGQPKGVKISHRALWHYYSWFGSFDLMQTCNRVDFSTNLTFDAAITTSLVALAYGKTISVCPEDIKNSPHTFLQYLILKKIDLCKCTPSYFRLLLNESQTSHVQIPQTINWLLTGEEMCPKDSTAWLERHPHHVFYNSYGPTEATVTCSKFKIDRHNINDFSTNIPIERDSRACCFNIIDSKMRQVPHGVKGELLIEGPVLANGYLSKPEETDKSFVNDENNSLWYRTGDEVMSKPDGSIFYFGRLDNQVKIRGIRVELEEIRFVICSLNEVLDAKVITRKIEGVQKLFAFIVPKQPVLNESVFCDKIRSFLFTKIPSAMTPEHLIILKKIPSNLAGKVDIQELNMIAKSRPFEAEKMLVTNPLEMSLLQIWRESLPPNKIGTDTNFFHLGGHSLLAMVVMDKINRYLNTSLPPSLLFQKPTIRELGQAIYDKKANHNLHHINHNENCPILFLIHPATGLAHVYQDLKVFLKEIDFYALSHDRFGELQNPYASIEEMASSYIQTLLTHCPKGPYVIGGFCTGGVVAFEMIKQLESLGVGPCALVLIDSFKLSNLGSQQERDLYNKSQLEFRGIPEKSSLGQKLIQELEHNRYLVANYSPGLYTGHCLFIECNNLDPEEINNHSLRELKKQNNGWSLSLTSSLVTKRKIEASHRTLFRDPASIQNIGEEIYKFCFSFPKI